MLSPNQHQSYSIPAIIMNATPDSNFCERVESFDLFHHLLKKWEELYPQAIIDVGGESTSPLNRAISGDQESSRLERTLGRVLREQLWPDSLTLSLDTYRPQTVRQFLPLVAGNKVVIWNDVSGRYADREVIELMTLYPQLFYVVGHNPVGKRQGVARHMKLVSSELSGEEVLEQVATFFDTVSDFFNSKSLLDRVIFDPCFSFGKSIKQTLFLANHIESLITRFPQQQRWMLGASRKSFLRDGLSLKKDLPEQVVIKAMEIKHLQLLRDWQQKLSGHALILRIHDPSLFDLSQKSVSL